MTLYTQLNATPLNGSGTNYVAGSVSFTASSSLAATPLMQLGGSVDLSASSSLSATPALQLSAPQVTLSASSSLSATPFQPPTVELAASSSLSAIPSLQLAGSAALSTQSSLSPSGVLLIYGIGQLPASSSLSVTLKGHRRASCNLSATSSLTASPLCTKAGSVNLSAQSSLDASASCLRPASVSLTVSSSLYANPYVSQTLPESWWHTAPFRIAGIPIEFPSSTGLSVSWSDVGGHTTKRMANGRDAAATYWTRKRLEISGEGQAPAGLDMVDWTVPQWVEGAMPLSLPFGGLSAELPQPRSQDRPATVTALVGGGSSRLDAALDGDTATASEVEGAYGYVVEFTPKFRALLARSVSVDRSTGASSWKITAEEL